jgi:hypothetical protein
MSHIEGLSTGYDKLWLTDAGRKNLPLMASCSYKTVSNNYRTVAMDRHRPATTNSSLFPNASFIAHKYPIALNCSRSSSVRARALGSVADSTGRCAAIVARNRSRISA